MDKRDFAYFEGLFNYEVKKFNGFIEHEKSGKAEFNERVNEMDEQVRLYYITHI
jgi:hypothetical protein